MTSVLKTANYQQPYFSKIYSDLLETVKHKCSHLKKYGIHPVGRMRSAGFEYIGTGDTARCNICNLEISGWTQDMDPFHIHSERKPDCSFVQSIHLKNQARLSSIENSAKRHKSDNTTDQFNLSNKSVELEIIKQVRQRTFSHCPESIIGLKDALINAGFFACNVGDRVICIYCNLICQQWNKDTDDPVEVHKTFSPQCPYVSLMLKQDEMSSAFVLNGISTDTIKNHESLLENVGRLNSDHIVYTSPCHTNYTSISNRERTFAAWSAETAPSVDDLVKAGFFFTGVKNIVTCFYCNGSLQNWSQNDSPLIEHIRWFPHCPYAKQLAGDNLYDKIRKAQQPQQGLPNSQIPATSSTTNNQPLDVTNVNILSRLVAARLDLPISQQLLNQNFKLSIIKRCWEDQLRLKRDDFVSDCDLHIACIILQKQIDHINGNKDKIIVPSIKMKEIQNSEQSDTPVVQQLPSSSLPPNSSNQSLSQTNNSSVKSTVSSDESMTMVTSNDPSAMENSTTETTIIVNNPCIMCQKQEKRLACIPCGHLATCVDCSQTLRTCPMCRQGIEAFVRIYI